MTTITRSLLAVGLSLAPALASVGGATPPPPPPPTPTINVVANGFCAPDGPAVEFTVTATDTNSDVRVLFNSIQVWQGSIGSSLEVTDSRPAAGGSVTVTANAVGAWGSGASGAASASITVDVPSECGSPGVGRFTGGGKSIDTGSGLKVTKGFTIHCDLILSNNLEINWPGAGGRTNQFHMLEHTAATCTDDPAIDQRPPAAPVDTIVGVGTGRFNGELGYTVYFTLVDAGEPGTADQIAFRIVNSTTGAQVLNLPLQNIVGGNVQAHYDQPHKK